MPALHVNLSEEAHAGWSRLAAEQGVTVSALIEVLGKHLPDALDAAALEEVIVEARQLAHERARAGGPRKKT